MQAYSIIYHCYHIIRRSHNAVVYIKIMNTLHHSGQITSYSCVAQLVERRSLASELTLSCTQPAADG